MTNYERRFRMWAVARLGCKNGFSILGLHKIHLKKVLLQQGIYHPLFVIGCLGPVVLWPRWYTALWGGFALALEHEFTQFFSRQSGTRNLNLAERAIDVCGFLLGSQLLWWGLR